MHMNAPEYHHGASQRALLRTQKGLSVVKWSFFALMATALLQAAVVAVSSSAGLLADTVHNIGDALTAVPLWIAFKISPLKPNKRFTYGYGRAEDLVGIVVFFTIVLSGVFCAAASLYRFWNPQPVQSLWLVSVASIIGFFGNEWVAILRIKTGREIGSATLIAEGNHARVDALTSLAVVAGMVGTALGYPVADAAVGLLISVMILRIAWDTGKSVLFRFMDVIDTDVIDEIKEAAASVPMVQDVSEVRARWIGHRIFSEINLAVDGSMSVENAHDVADKVREAVLSAVPHLSQATIHVDPDDKSGEKYHEISE